MQTAPALWQNKRLPGVSFGLLMFFVILYVGDPLLYRHVISLWSFKMTLRPFIDSEYVTAQLECWRRGVDVYTVAPCDPLGRLQDYPPLFLRMWFLPVGRGWAVVYGIVQDLLFIAALGCLPAVAGWRSGLLLAAAALSPSTVFAMERGNIDLVIFALMVAGLVGLERRFAWRLLGYSFFMVGALLKFYPLVLFARVVGERPRRFVGIAMATTAVVVAFVIAFGAETRLAIANVPVPNLVGDGFSARQLPEGLALLVGAPWLAVPLLLAMVAVVGVLAARQAAAVEYAAAYGAVSRRAASCLSGGALLFCGVFLLVPSIGYRGIVLLVALPGVLLLGRAAPSVALRRQCRMVALAMVLVMWSLVPMRVFGDLDLFGPVPFAITWLTRELLCWLIFTALLGVVVRFARDASPWAAVSPPRPVSQPRG